MITIKLHVWRKSIFINRLQGCPLHFYTILKEIAVWRKDDAIISRIWKSYIGPDMGFFSGKAANPLALILQEGEQGNQDCGLIRS